MIECIVNTLVKKFDVKRDVAYLFYCEIYNRRKIEDFLINCDRFKSFDELKKHYLGGI